MPVAEQTVILRSTGDLAALLGERVVNDSQVPDGQGAGSSSWFAEVQGSRDWIRSVGGKDDRPSDALVQRVRDAMRRKWRPE